MAVPVPEAKVTETRERRRGHLGSMGERGRGHHTLRSGRREGRGNRVLALIAGLLLVASQGSGWSR